MTTQERRFGVLGLTLVFVLAIPPVRDGFERTMAAHVAAQLAGLAVAGWFLGAALRRQVAGISRSINANGACGLATSLFAAAYWMLPRTLDEALSDTYIEAAKFLVVPLFVGFPLALSWPSISPVLRAFLKASLLSMLAVLGWFYTVAPERLCTSYLQGDQAFLGELLYLLAGGLALAWALPHFISDGRDGSPAAPFPREPKAGTMRDPSSAQSAGIGPSAYQS